MREGMNEEEMKYMEKIIDDNKNINILKLTFEEIERKKREIEKKRGHTGPPRSVPLLDWAHPMITAKRAQTRKKQENCFSTYDTKK